MINERNEPGISGISGQDADLRLADRLARLGARPTHIFAEIRNRYSVQERDDRHPEAIPSDRYIDSVVFRAFLALHIEAVASGCVMRFSEERFDEMYSMLAGDGEASDTHG